MGQRNQQIVRDIAATLALEKAEQTDRPARYVDNEPSPRITWRYRKMMHESDIPAEVYYPLFKRVYKHALIYLELNLPDDKLEVVKNAFTRWAGHVFAGETAHSNRNHA